MASQPLMEGRCGLSATDSDSLSRLKWTRGGISTVIHLVQGTMFNNKKFWLQRGLLCCYKVIIAIYLFLTELSLSLVTPFPCLTLDPLLSPPPPAWTRPRSAARLPTPSLSLNKHGSYTPVVTLHGGNGTRAGERMGQEVGGQEVGEAGSGWAGSRRGRKWVGRK